MTSSEVGDLVITNKHIVDITVTKNWDDDEDRTAFGRSPWWYS